MGLFSGLVEYHCICQMYISMKLFVTVEKSVQMSIKSTLVGTENCEFGKNLDVRI